VVELVQGNGHLSFPCPWLGGALLNADDWWAHLAPLDGEG